MDNFKDKVANTFKTRLSEIFTGIIILALLVYSFVGIGMRDKIDEGFWTAFAVNFSLMLLTMFVWFPDAKRKAQQRDVNYIAQRKRYGELVNKITDTNNQKNLHKFCDYATEQNRLFKIKQKLIKMNVDFDVYEKYLKKPSKVDEVEELTDRQKKKLKKLIQDGVKIKKISSARIITGIKGAKARYDTTSGEQAYDTFVVTFKIVVSIISSVVVAYMVFSTNGFTWESVAQFFVWVIVILWNAMTSYNAGYKSISIKRADYYKKLKTFLEEFVSSDYYKKEEIVAGNIELIKEEASV